jgi:hypothetical protein
VEGLGEKQKADPHHGSVINLAIFHMAYVICGQHHKPSVPIPIVYVFWFLKYKSKPLIKGKSTKVVFSKVLALVEYSPESGPIVTLDIRGPPAPLPLLPVHPFVAVFCRSTRANTHGARNTTTARMAKQRSQEGRDGVAAIG